MRFADQGPHIAFRKNYVRTTVVIIKEQNTRPEQVPQEVLPRDVGAGADAVDLFPQVREIAAECLTHRFDGSLDPAGLVPAA